MDINSIIVSATGGLISFGVGFIGWYIRKLSADVNSVQSELAKDADKIKDRLQTFEVEVARNYVTKMEFSELKQWLIGEFKDVKDLIKDKVDKK